MQSLFFELEAGRLGRGEGNQSRDTGYATSKAFDLLDSLLLKSLFRSATREKINFKRSGESRNKRNNGVICDQEGRENQIA